MKKRLFTDSGVPPTETLLRKQMGKAFDYYTSMLSISGQYRKQWQFGSGTGWLLKVDDMRKALFYLMPFDLGVDISLAVREGERDELLKSKPIEPLHPQLASAKKYAEGYALRFEIESDKNCATAMALVQKLIDIRALKPAEAARQPKSKKTAKLPG